jgi:hypothetical protein
MPTAVTPKPQPDWMKWRAAVTCREREKLILNVTVFVERVWGRTIERGSDTQS